MNIAQQIKSLIEIRDLHEPLTNEAEAIQKAIDVLFEEIDSAPMAGTTHQEEQTLCKIYA